MYHQRWSDAPCRRQVGQTPRRPGSHDAVHMSGKRPWGVELYCLLTAERSEKKKQQQHFSVLKDKVCHPIFLLFLSTLPLP